MGLDFSDIVQDDTPAVEIMIENPDDVVIGIDGVEIDLMPEDDDIEFDANLAEHMNDGELQSIASELIELIEADMTSRKDWAEMYVKGLDVLGMKYEERTEPWDGACGVFSTVLTEAAIRFQSETIIETFPAKGPVKTEIIGAIDKLKEELSALRFAKSDEKLKIGKKYNIDVKDPEAVRKEIVRIEDENRPRYANMKWYLDAVGLPFAEVVKTVNAIPRLY
jgi:hypothetical protein